MCPHASIMNNLSVVNAYEITTITDKRIGGRHNHSHFAKCAFNNHIAFTGDRPHGDCVTFI